MQKFFRVVQYVATGILILLTVLVITQVLLRNLFNRGFVWSEEMARFLLLSMVFMATPVVFFAEGHVRIDFLPSRLKGIWHKTLEIVVVAISLIFFAAFIVSFFDLMSGVGDVPSPSLNLPNRFYYLSGLIGAVLSIVAGIARLFGPSEKERQ